MIKRDIIKELKILLREYPVVTILGPRKAGKTTLVKDILKGYEYSNLEIPEVRQFTQEDPKAYLAQFKSKIIIDEIQRVPELLSYIQAEVDILFQNGRDLIAIEVKSSMTFSSSHLKGIKTMKKIAPNIVDSYLVYSGDAMKLSDDIQAIHFSNIEQIFEM